MARLSALFLALLLAAACAVALVACGGGEDADLLPGTTADQIEANLNEVEELADAEDCIGAESAVAEVMAQVEELQGVDQKLKAALQEGTAKLSELVGRCEEETEEETEPSVETDVEPEEVEDDEKPKKEKPDKDEEKSSDPDEPVESDEGPELPPQANGKGEEKGGGGESSPPVAPEPEEAPAPSGGVGPSVGVE
jgi:outer membrane biosynthesis protein TonB